MTERAKSNLEKMLPNYKCSYENTDGEYFELFHNFLYDEVLSNSTLSDRSNMLVILSTLIVNQSINEYKRMVEAALNLQVTPEEIKEVLYQATPYAGYAKVVDFIDATNEVFSEHNVKLPLSKQGTTTRDNRMEKGLEKQYEYNGRDRIDAMRNNAPADQKHFYDFLAGYCFGDFYTRGALDDRDRELITFCFIASLRGCESQLMSHVNANLKVGNTKETLIGAITVLCPYVGFPRTLNALKIVNDVCK